MNSNPQHPLICGMLSASGSVNGCAAGCRPVSVGLRTGTDKSVSVRVMKQPRQPAVGFRFFPAWRASIPVGRRRSLPTCVPHPVRQTLPGTPDGRVIFWHFACAEFSKGSFLG